jgi:UDP-N-acetylmuramoyl-L-alanyl-D-glutamate--2,6-diaminopimelate ligase
MSVWDRIINALTDAGLVVTLPEWAPDAASHDIAGVTDDSRLVREGWLFCAVKGTAQDGNAFVADAAAQGAAAIITASRCPVDVPQVIVTDDREATAVAAAEWFGRPADRLELIGVTGTNGKSTTVLLIRHLLNAAEDVGAIGTLGAFDGHGVPLYREGLTTPGVVGLQETLAILEEGGVGRVVMEVSSHALDQRRAAGLAFRAAVFTNLTQDHLDYHADLEEYRQAKLRLVGLVPDDGVLIANAEDPAWRDLPEVPRRLVRFGSGSTVQVRASDVNLGPEGTTLTLTFADHAGSSQRVETPLVGAFNVSNVLAAAAAAWCLGEDPATIAERLATVPQVPGRMERLVSEPFLVLRDYAHTPDALRRAIEAARPLARNQLVVLFGCGGDRDRRKRAPMGTIAVQGADVVILTSDNPRTEDPDRILDDVAEGMAGHAFLRVADRREAIGRAIAMLEPGDCLLLAGKGHETYQIIGTERLPFDEADIVSQLVAGEARL